MRRYKLEDARNLVGISQQQLADELGVSFVTVARWEAGTQTPESPFIGKLCKRFRVKHPHDLNLDAEFNHNVPTHCREDELLTMLELLDRRQLIALFSKLSVFAGVDLTVLFSATLVAPDHLLSLCSTVIDHCWGLLEEGNNAIANTLLAECISKLDGLATHTSPHQHQAASLATDATILQMIIATLSMNYKRRVSLGDTAVRYGELSRDTNVHIMAIGWHGSTYTNCFQQPGKAIDIYTSALPLLDNNSPLNQVGTYIEFAKAYALDRNETMSRDYLEQAHMSMPEHPELDPLYRPIGIGHAELDQYEGNIYLILAKHFPSQKEYPQLAYDAFVKCTSKQSLSVGYRSQQLITKADAARGIGEMHECLDSLTDGVHIAFQANSQKGISKAITILQKAPRSWRTEPKYKELRKLLTPNIVTQ